MKNRKMAQEVTLPGGKKEKNCTVTAHDIQRETQSNDKKY